MAKNLSKAYYLDYFKNIEFSYVLDADREVTKRNVSSIKSANEGLLRAADRRYCREALAVYDAEEALVTDTFSLCVQYPGLVTGVGITHEAKIEGEFKLGVHFDYTSGLPVVYGSSVKGVLRSVLEKEGYWEVLEGLPDALRAKLEKIPAGDLVDELFEGKAPGGDATAYRSIYERDVFFDAILEEANEKGRLLESDSITPHGRNPLKNPVPITFLRIAAGCRLKFRFRLASFSPSLLNVEEKRMLFKAVLATFGAGAKTNIGYGQFRPG